jgi:hypothetical protein
MAMQGQSAAVAQTSGYHESKPESDRTLHGENEAKKIAGSIFLFKQQAVLWLNSCVPFGS